MIGQNISHYKILEKLGEGGMGVVYKAEDTKLKREVAIKFLPHQTSSTEEEGKRFRIEAQAAAALNHPNIATIHAIEEFDNVTFIVMEYIEGLELKQKFADGPLHIDNAIDIATQIANGLQVAHKKGITHRDIKSANIMLTENDQVKIMDFGLAKLGGRTQLTKTGSTMGTVAYMSPEQTLGTEVDNRTDIWALGIVLYEMLTGQLPFMGDHELAVLYSILNEEPEPIENLRVEVPKDLSVCIQKMLSKNVDQRYQKLEEVLNDLKSPTGTTIVSHPRVEKGLTKRNRNYLISGLSSLIVMSLILAIFFWKGTAENDMASSELDKLVGIAVLPFDNISPDPNDEYLADGMTDEMISKLSKIRNFRVIARTSVMRYKKSLKSVPEIGEELNVGSLLEGSVRKVANNLRITVQLVDIKTQAPIWSNEYNRQLEDVFDIQDEVSRSIVDALELTLSQQEEQLLIDRSIENIHAYESYVRARQAILAFDVNAMQRALRDVQNTLEIVGDNELLYSTMGWLYAHSVEAGVQTTEDYYQKAEELASKIFDLNPDSFYGYALRGKIRNGLGNTQEAVRNLKRAYLINSRNPDVMLTLSYNYIKSGNSSEAKPLLEELLTIDPLTPLNYNIRGFLDLMEGRFNLGLEYYSKMYELGPESPGVRLFYAWCLAANQRIDEAGSIVDLLAKDSPQTVLAHLGLFLKHALRGEKEEALHSFTPTLNAVATNVEYLSRVIADCFALIDEKGEAMNWLENSVNLGFIHYPYLAEYNPFLQKIRGEERFKHLLEKVKYRWKNFEI